MLNVEPRNRSLQSSMKCAFLSTNELKPSHIWGLCLFQSSHILLLRLRLALSQPGWSSLWLFRWWLLHVRKISVPLKIEWLQSWNGNMAILSEPQKALKCKRWPRSFRKFWQTRPSEIWLQPEWQKLDPSSKRHKAVQYILWTFMDSNSKMKNTWTWIDNSANDFMSSSLTRHLGSSEIAFKLIIKEFIVSGPRTSINFVAACIPLC